MTKKLMDKMGINVFHDDYSGKNVWNVGQVDRALNFAKMAGMKYIRPAFNLQTDEFNGADNPWRLSTYHKIQDAGLIGIEGAFPQQIKNHLLDSNADDLIDQAIRAYAHIMDRFINDGITSFCIEGWNEADGVFADSDQSQAQTNDTVIDKYLTFNMKLCEEAHKRNIKFMDLCSIQYLKAPDLKHVMDCYNTKLSSYSSQPDWVSFHPYCEKDNANNIPEKYLNTLQAGQTGWSNIAALPMAVSEFGFPSEDWGDPFSGSWPAQYARDVMIRQIIIMDYIGIDPIVVYSGNTNPDPSDAGKDDCWGTYQYSKSDGSIRLSKLGAVELEFFQSMIGYHLSNAVLLPNGYSDQDYEYSNYAFEYTNDEGHKKLFYWNPFGYNTSSLNWNGNSYNLTFTQHVKEIDA